MDLKPVMIFGANPLGVVVKEIFDSNKVVTYGFLDDDKERHGEEIGDVSVLGSTNDQGFLKYIGKKCDAFVAHDDNKVRKALVKMLNEKRKVMPVNAIHKYAHLEDSAEIGHGNLISSGVVVNTEAKIGNHTIIHSHATIDHHATIGSYAQIGAGSIINSEASVEEEAFVGSGAVIVSGITVGKGARVGAGSVVISDVQPGQTVFGNPASIV